MSRSPVALADIEYAIDHFGDTEATLAVNDGAANRTLRDEARTELLRTVRALLAVASAARRLERERILNLNGPLGRALARLSRTSAAGRRGKGVDRG